MLAELEPLSATFGAYAFVIVLGLLWGSFANVCIYRWPPTDEFPKGRSVVKPGSHCFACGKPVRWYDNVPMLSYLWLRGKCRDCKTAFSARYLIVEGTMAALFGVAWWSSVVAGALFEPFSARLVRFAVQAGFCFVMVVIAFIDLDTKLILEKLTFPSIAIFYLLGLLLPGVTWWNGLVGAAIGYGGPWLIGEIFYRIRGKEGLGLGDSALLALVGALLGWKGVVVSLCGGSLVGTVIVGLTLVTGRGRGLIEQPEPDPESVPEPVADGEEADEPSLLGAEVPFGPFLAIGAVFYLFAEPWISLHFALSGG